MFDAWVLGFFLQLLKCYEAYGNISLKAITKQSQNDDIHIHVLLSSFRSARWKKFNEKLPKQVLHVSVIPHSFIISGVIMMYLEIVKES